MRNNKYLRGSLSPSNFFDLREYRCAFAKAHPDYFPLDGLIVFRALLQFLQDFQQFFLPDPPVDRKSVV